MPDYPREKVVACAAVLSGLRVACVAAARDGQEGADLRFARLTNSLTSQLGMSSALIAEGLEMVRSTGEQIGELAELGKRVADIVKAATEGRPDEPAPDDNPSSPTYTPVEVGTCRYMSTAHRRSSACGMWRPLGKAL